MAKTVAVVVSDDLDGSPGARTVSFGLDGKTYEIDLTEKNRAKLARTIAPYVQAGRRVTGSRGRGAARQGSARVGRADIRTWAKEHGLAVSGRGRISAEVIQKYEAAQ
jgi:Lsr2